MSDAMTKNPGEANQRITLHDFETAFAQFMTRAQAIIDDYPDGHNGVLSATPLKRYIRIVITAHDGGYVGVYRFVDRTNGDVLKPAGWNSPAKNFARGNIYDAQNGCGWMSRSATA